MNIYKPSKLLIINKFLRGNVAREDLEYCGRGRFRLKTLRDGFGSLGRPAGHPYYLVMNVTDGAVGLTFEHDQLIIPGY